MANATTEVLQTLRAMLLGDSTITGLVKRRVRTSHVANADESTLVYPLVIVAPIGGTSMSNRSVMSTSIEVFVYSKVSISEALEIYEAIYSVLQSGRLNLTGTTPKGVCYEASRPREGCNNSLISHYVRATYDVLSAG